MQSVPLPDFWDSVPGTIPVRERGSVKPVSFDEVLDEEIVTVIVHYPLEGHPPFGYETPRPGVVADVPGPVMVDRDLLSFSEEHAKGIVRRREPRNVRWVGREELALDLQRAGPEDDGVFAMFGCSYNRKPIYLQELPDQGTVGVGFFAYKPSHIVVLNRSHALVEWDTGTTGTNAVSVTKTAESSSPSQVPAYRRQMVPNEQRRHHQ